MENKTSTICWSFRLGEKLITSNGTIVYVKKICKNKVYVDITMPENVEVKFLKAGEKE